MPYVSLNYCTEWRDQLELRVEELEGVEHREILSTPPPEPVTRLEVIHALLGAEQLSFACR